MVNAEPLVPLPLSSTAEERKSRYKLIIERLDLILQDESNFLAALATIACEVHYGLEYSHWTGFYLLDSKAPTEQLVVGPYQGSLACLRIPINRGVCGAAARLRTVQLVPDVHAFPGHIACSSTTLSEVVVPILAPGDENEPFRLLGVLDLDSNDSTAFNEADVQGLKEICDWIGRKWPQWR